MFIVRYVEGELPWLRVSDVRELILNSLARGTPLILKGNLLDQNILLKPAEEFPSVTFITNYRLNKPLESRATKIEGSPKIPNPRFEGLRILSPVIAESFELLSEAEG